MKKTSDLAGL